MAEDIRAVVVKREGSVESGYAEMGGPLSPNMEVRALPWYSVIAIRCARVFVQSLLGTFTVSEFMTGDVDTLTRIKASMLLAAATVFYTALQNAYELLTKLDQKYPEMRA